MPRAHQEADPPATRRIVVASLVVGLHALLIASVWKVRETLRPRTPERDRFIALLRIPQERPAEDASSAAERAQDIVPSPPRSNAPSGSAGSAAPPTPQAPSIDWSAHAGYFARKAVGDAAADRYRNLGPHQPSQPAEIEPPPVFESEPEVFGEIAEDVHGDPIVRLSKYCYQELEKRLPTARDHVDPGHPLLRKCMFPIGEPEPRGDLFDHLKRDRAVPEPKAGSTSKLAEPNPEHEGR